MKPLGGGPPKIEPLPTGDAPAVSDCPVCEAEIDDQSDLGGACGTCGESTCVRCMMRANGVKVAASSEKNRERWDEFVGGAESGRIRCPACGKTGVKPS